jgi:hypothetical protein
MGFRFVPEVFTLHNLKLLKSKRDPILIRRNNETVSESNNGAGLERKRQCRLSNA